MPKPILIICPHAAKQLKERGITENLVKMVLFHHGQVIESYGGRNIAQDIIEHNRERFLVRVVYEETEKELKVVTVYLTTKIEKYWR